ncbi:3-methyladenine DNA glycosylase [Propionibacteriaceae bacterium Y1923]|uniref:3-methyladenine DNA glycosylase n=1 Tax=Aestuariimicrobium sp. Y1814 TaxID=3418742 RepID=UPI003C26EDBD
MHVLTRDQWQARRAAHEQRAGVLLADVVERRSRGQRHPVEDFMFDYYRLRPGQLTEWHPGAGVALADADEFADRRWYTRLDDGLVGVDVAAVTTARAGTIEFTGDLLRATTERAPRFDCFGMHEWAMVYGLAPDQVRHAGLPLRFTPEVVRQVVDDNGLRCSHYDAFRFFTDEAAPRNQHQLARDDQVRLDQAGCLHVTMDLYKYAGKLLPLTSSELLLDCYELALDVRELDMRASAYDLSDWGYDPVPVETPAGKATYVASQREFSRRATGLRSQLLDLVTRVAA